MSRSPLFKFRLYVAGNAPNSTQAIANLNALCRARLLERCAIEIVDVFKEPKRALADGIFMTPTLVMASPLPMRRVIGNLSQVQTVIEVLGLEAPAA